MGFQRMIYIGTAPGFQVNDYYFSNNKVITLQNNPNEYKLMYPIESRMTYSRANTKL